MSVFGVDRRRLKRLTQQIEQQVVVFRLENSYATMLADQPPVYGANDKQYEQIRIDDNLVHGHGIN